MKKLTSHLLSTNEENLIEIIFKDIKLTIIPEMLFDLKNKGNEIANYNVSLEKLDSTSSKGASVLPEGGRRTMM